MSKEIKILASWDCEGFECLRDISGFERQALLNDIKGVETRDELSLNAMMLRARYNPQRSPEIWVFTSTVDFQTIQDLSKEQPQVLVDLIRNHGNCVWKQTPQKRAIE